jgi:hypothetical protein
MEALVRTIVQLENTKHLLTLVKHVQTHAPNAQIQQLNAQLVSQENI